LTNAAGAGSGSRSRFATNSASPRPLKIGWATPPSVQERHHLIGRSDPVLDRYARITFEKLVA
jgi:hypothetical protein